MIRLGFITLITAIVLIAALGAWRFIEAVANAAAANPESTAQIAGVVLIIALLNVVSLFKPFTKGRP